MTTHGRNLRPHAARILACAVTCCLLFAALVPAPAHAKIRQKSKKPVPARIEILQKDRVAVLRPGSGITFVAKVYAKNGDLIEGGKVEWDSSGSDEVMRGEPLDQGTRHEVTLVGFSHEGRAAQSADIRLSASVSNGTVSTQIIVPYHAKINIAVAEADAVKGKPIVPGMEYPVSAKVKDGDADVDGAKVRWELASAEQRKYVLLVTDDSKPNTASLVGLTASDPKAAPKSVGVVAIYGGMINHFSVPYSATGQADDSNKPRSETAKVKTILVGRGAVPPADPCASPSPAPTPSSPFDEPVLDYDIESGQRLTLAARLVKEDCNDAKELPRVVWSVPEEMSKHIAIQDQRKDGSAVFYGLTPEPGDGEAARESLYVLVQAVDKAEEGSKGKDKDAIKFVKAVPIRNGAQTVDVAWNILPNDVVAKNYGRGVSDKFYGIEVVIGNNSGNDLQLTGLSFEIDRSLLRDSANLDVLPRMPASSYEVVRGMTEQRNFSFKRRGTILSTLEAAAQIMTGFTPYFQVATRARNYAQAINILGNPVTKGIERVWPDPQQDELGRLERQALHDDKIIPNNSVYRTTVFFPRDLFPKPAPGTSGGQKLVAGTPGGQGVSNNRGEDDLMAIRKQLGQLILVGSKLNRNDFQMRVRQGFRQSAAGTNR